MSRKQKKSRTPPFVIANQQQKSRQSFRAGFIDDQRGSVSLPHAPHMHGLPHVQRPNVYLAWPSRRTMIATAVLLSSFLQAIGIAFALYARMPQQVNFSFEQQAVCSQQFSIFPEVQPSVRDHAFQPELRGGFTLGSRHITSSSLCVEATQLPQENTQEPVTVRAFGNPLLSQKTHINIESSARVVEQPNTEEPLAISEDLQFILDKPDSLFTYHIASNNNQNDCEVDQTRITCPTAKLNFKQSNTYSVDLLRTFPNSQPEIIYTGSFNTVEAVHVTKASVQDKQIVYSKPQSISITFDQRLVDVRGVKLTNTTTDTVIDTMHTIEGTKAVIAFEAELPREHEFTIHIENAVAQNKGELAKPFSRSFSTSGGPRVVSSSLATYGTSYTPSFSITFDTAVDAASVQKRISLTANNEIIATTVTITGNVATVVASQSVGACVPFAVNLSSGTVSVHGVSGGKAWQRTSRSLCQKISSIGLSQEGRYLTSYTFGSGPKTYLFVGGTHGTEPSSIYTLNSWVDALEAQFSRIPSNTRVIVVPNVNPDGTAKGDRKNANGVDLNRNFPANNWKKDVTVPGGELVKNGGGTEPLSEPESAALASFTTAISPALVLTYHARGSLAVANESGDSLARAQTYGSLSGFSALANSQLGDTFDYDTTGAYEDWLHDKVGIPALLIELTTSSGNEFSSQQAAMWAMIE